MSADSRSATANSAAAGASTHNYAKPPTRMEDDEEGMKIRRMSIARKLLEGVDFPKVKGQTRVRDRKEPTHAELRYQRTLQLITNPAHQNLYSMTLERKLMTETGLESVIEELQLIASRHSHARVLILALRDSLKRSLFGCEINVALCSDASATQLEFIGEAGGYVRKVSRGQSTCFECLDQRDVVLQMVTKSKAETDNTVPVRILCSFLRGGMMTSSYYCCSTLPLAML
jgi:hypothetical protein